MGIEKINEPKSDVKDNGKQETTLDKMVPGQKCEVISMGEAGPVRTRFIDMGLRKGATVAIVRIAPMGDPIEVSVIGYNLSLRKEEAKNISVRLV